MGNRRIWTSKRMTKPMWFGILLLIISLIIDIIARERTDTGMLFQLLATMTFIFVLLTDTKTIYTDEERLVIMGAFKHITIKWDDIDNYTGTEFGIIVHANKLSIKSIQIDLRYINNGQTFLNMIDSKLNSVALKRFKTRNGDQIRG